MNFFITAQFNDETIRVYQAFRDEIADEAVELGKFGEHFRISRMSWIKPSFLWMMYRSGWATKVGQERILAIDIKCDAFNYILSQMVKSSFDKDVYETYENWKKLLFKTSIVCQFDPDRDIFGNPIDRRAIQIGLSGQDLKRYKKDWVVKITDITQEVINIRESIINNKFDKNMLPTEKEYSM